MKICHFSDIHLSPLGHIPQSRTENYHKEVKEEIQALEKAIKEENADIVLCTGDLFHLKNQSAYSPRDLNYYKELFANFPTFYTIPGNHDMPKSAIANIKDSPYTSLREMLPKVIRDISFQYTKIPMQGYNFDTFVLIGIPYVPMSVFKSTVEKFLVTLLPDLTECGRILFGFMIHVDATPEKMLVTLWESFSFQELAECFPKNSVIFMGHIHVSFPPWQDPKRNVTISKPWSIGRVVKDYFNQTDILEKQHIPSYSVITLEDVPEGLSMKIAYKEIPGYKKGHDIFQVESLQTQLEKSKEIQSFIQGLKKTLSADNIFFTQSPMVYLKGLNLQKEVFDVITEYLNR